MCKHTHIHTYTNTRIGADRKLIVHTANHLYSLFMQVPKNKFLWYVPVYIYLTLGHELSHKFIFFQIFLKIILTCIRSHMHIHVGIQLHTTVLPMSKVLYSFGDVISSYMFDSGTWIIHESKKNEKISKCSWFMIVKLCTERKSNVITNTRINRVVKSTIIENSTAVTNHLYTSD